MEIIRLEKVEKIYRSGKTEQKALEGIDLSITTGEFISIAGPSGSGKTTLLNLIGCLDKPTAGEVIVDEVRVKNLDHNQLADLRSQKIGFIFQTFNLIPVLTAYENVEFPLLLRHNTNAEERNKMITGIFAEVGLAEYMHRRPTELSGGQQQRVAVVRALIKKPKLILADEPTANLDSGTGKAILQIMKELNKKNNISFVFSTHDRMVMDFASRLIILKDGKIIKDINQDNSRKN
ncbi:ABC transporter [bacterium SM23_31]|nr:MAG: ABC transporter [bacterium SM23_31]